MSCYLNLLSGQNLYKNKPQLMFQSSNIKKGTNLFSYSIAWKVFLKIQLTLLNPTSKFENLFLNDKVFQHLYKYIYDI